MSHEPECPQYNAPHNTFCVCNVLSSAYQRGRKDAAEATVPVSRKFTGILTTYADAVYIAALGGGEQK